MKCSQCAKLLDDYVRGKLTGETASEISEHIANCESCAKEYEVNQNLILFLKKEPESAIRENELADFLPGVWGKIETGKKRERSWIFRWAPIFATAAILAVLVFRSVSNVDNVKPRIGLDSAALQNLSNVGDTVVTENDYLGIARTIFADKPLAELNAIESELTGDDGIFVEGTIIDDISIMDDASLTKLEEKLRIINENAG
jgi:predicted anti-sigma-YlaC factor YlaD